MRGKTFYFIVAAVLAALLAVAGVLTYSLLDTDISNRKQKSARPAVRQPEPPPRILESAVIDANEPPKPKPPPADVSVLPGNFGNRPTERLVISPPSARPASAKVYSIRSTAEPIGEISLLAGRAFVTGTDNRRRSLAGRKAVSFNDRIETDSMTRLAVRFFDGTTLALGGNSEVLLASFPIERSKTVTYGLTVKLLKGTCRILTASDPDTTPFSVIVCSRSATITLRDCDLAIRSSQDRDEIYLLDIKTQKSISVTGTRDGAQTLNLLTGDSIPTTPENRQTIEISTPMTAVSSARGKGLEQRTAGMAEARTIAEDTSPLISIPHNALQKPDGSIFKLDSTPQPPDQTQQKTKGAK